MITDDLKALIRQSIDYPNDLLRYGIIADYVEERPEMFPYDTNNAISVLRNWTSEKLSFYSGFAALRGCTIEDLSIGLQDWLLFQGLDLEGQPIKRGYIADGDCCSSSWFYSIEQVDKLYGSPIIAFIDIETKHVNPDDGLGTQSYDQVYGVGIVTLKGVTRVIYRNSSNGYYGGYIYPADDNSLVGIDWVRISDNWWNPRKLQLEQSLSEVDNAMNGVDN